MVFSTAGDVFVPKHIQHHDFVYILVQLLAMA